MICNISIVRKKVHLFLNIINTIQNTFVYVHKIENAPLEYYIFFIKYSENFLLMYILYFNNLGNPSINLFYI